MLEGERPGIADEAEKERTASAQALQVKSLAALHNKACNTEATCTEYTCVHLAMQISSNPAIRNHGQASVGMRTTLASALSTLKANQMQALLDEAAK